MKKTVSRIRKRYHLTRNGLLRLNDRLQRLQEERLELVARLKQLRSQQATGHLAEDSMCIQTMSAIQAVDAEIERVEMLLANAEVIKNRKQRQRVNIGSTVRLAGKDGEIVYTIVPSIEANPFEGRISDESPLGKLLIGKKIKDFVTIPYLHRKKRQSVQLVGIE